MLVFVILLAFINDNNLGVGAERSSKMVSELHLAQTFLVYKQKHASSLRTKMFTEIYLQPTN